MVDARIVGPYEHRPGQWRCRILRDGVREWAPTADNPRQAKRLAQAIVDRIQTQSLTIGDALSRYESYKLNVRGNKPRSVVTTLHRLRGFFVDVSGSVTSINARKCQACYTTLTQRQAPDTHQCTLAEVGTFCRWLVKEGLLKEDPTKKIEKVGRKSHGKAQLMVDEARRWLHVARQHADQGEAGAVAAMMSLLMGLRTTEITERTAREVDDAGKLLWISDSKTKAGRRRVEVPEMLQPYLLRLKSDRQPTALLFGQHWRDWPRKWVQRICVEAGVPRVTAHGMRGLHATLALQAGIASHAVAQTLGHESPSVTIRSYAQPGSADIVPARRAVSTLLSN